MKLSLTILEEQWNTLYRKDGMSMKFYDKTHGFYRSVRFLSDHVRSLQSETLYVVSSPCPSLPPLIPSAAPDAALLFILPSGHDDLYETYHISSSLAMDHAAVTGCDASEAFNRLLFIYEKYDEYDARMLQALSDPLPLQKVLDLLCDIIGNPAYIADRNFRALAMDQNPDLPFYSINWKRIREHGYLPYHVVSSILHNDEWKDLDTSTAPRYMRTKEFSTAFLMMNLRAGHKVQWRLFVCELLKKITPADQDLVACLSGSLLQCLTSDWKYRPLQENTYEPFLREVAAGTLTSVQSVEEQLQPLRWNIDGSYCVLEMALDKYDGYLREVLDKELKKLADALLFLYDNRLLAVMYLPEAKAYEALHPQLIRLFDSLRLNGALSGCFYGFHHLSAYVSQTKRLLQLKETYASAGEPSGLSVYADYFMKDLYQQLQASLSPKTLFPWELQLLLAYDETHRSSLCETLWQFLQSHQNLVRTAREMHIHRNTLVYRLEKIRQLAGDFLDDPQKCTWLLISLALFGEEAAKRP